MLALEPFGRTEGNLCKMLPLRWRLMVICWDDMTRQRLPSGLGMTYLQVVCCQGLVPLQYNMMVYQALLTAHRVAAFNLVGIGKKLVATIQLYVHWCHNQQII